MKPPHFSCLSAVALAFVVIGAGLAPAQLAPRVDSELPNRSLEFQFAAAKKIDKFVGADFRKKGVRPLAKATDPEFLRRTYLNVIGRIPTYEEATAFLADTDFDKRGKLIDALLGSDGFNMHMFNWWADLLRATDEFQNISGMPYIKWIKDSIAENKPYDKMVHQLVAATGSGLQNGAIGYYVRDRGMLKDNMANTTRIFLGTRIECAQCHDHPFDSWKQMDFYEMAAFTEGIKGAHEDLSRALSRNEDQVQSEDRELYNVSRMVRYAVYDFSIADTGKGTIALPQDYKYRDGSPGEMVDGKTLFGKTVRVSTRAKRNNPGEARQKFADWLCSEDNPRFTRVIANRMWKRVMGTGLFEPLDNFSASSAPSNPALMAYLEELMRDLDYDLKIFQKVLYHSYAYGLSPNPVQHPARAPYHFNGRQLARLSAEQVWDSLLTLKVGVPDDRKGSGYGDGAIIFRGRPVLVGEKSMKDLYDEVIAISDSDAVWEYVKKLRDQMKAGGDGGEMGMSMKMASSAGSNFGQNMRASELSSPMPNGHFLRQFGQSNREVIEGASTDSDVTQVLSILNGHAEKNLTSNSGAAVYKALGGAVSDVEKIDRIFLSILSRNPTEEEREMFISEFETNPDSAEQTAVAALISTAEFIFVQ